MTPTKSHGQLYDVAAHCTCMSNHSKLAYLASLNCTCLGAIGPYAVYQ